MKTGRVMLGETDPVSLILGLADKINIFYLFLLKWGLEYN